MTVVKSYQDCTEIDVPGYNDCPSFLFTHHKTSASRRQHRVVLDHSNASEPIFASPGTQMCAIVSSPPISHRKHNETTPAEEDPCEPSLNKEEILQKVYELYGLESSLVVEEFNFYKKKVNDNLVNSLESDSTRSVMTQFFKEANNDRVRASNILREWMVSDVNVISWCPAFLRIFQHIEKTQTITTQ